MRVGRWRSPSYRSCRTRVLLEEARRPSSNASRQAFYQRPGRTPPPPRQRTREPTLQRPNRPKPEDRGRPRPLRGAGVARAPRPGVPASLDAVPGADLWREERPSPPLRVRGRLLPAPEDLAVEALSVEAALLSVARPHNPEPCLPASGWCSPPVTASAAGGPRRCRTSPTGSASRAKGCASCSPARRRRWHDAAASREQAERRPVGLLAPRAVSAVPTRKPLEFRNFGNVSDFRNSASRTRQGTLSAGSGDALAVRPVPWGGS
jgi:hypothetical protein